MEQENTIMANIPRPLPTRRELQFFAEDPIFQSWASHSPSSPTFSMITHLRQEIKSRGSDLKEQDYVHAVHDLAVATYIGYNEHDVSIEDAVFTTHDAVFSLPPLTSQLVKKTCPHAEKILNLCSVFADSAAQHASNLPRANISLDNTTSQTLNSRALCFLVRGLNSLSWRFRDEALKTKHIVAHPSQDYQDTFSFHPKNGDQRIVTERTVITASQVRAAAEVIGFLPTT